MMCIFLFLFLVPFLLKWLNAKLINRKAVSAGFLLTVAYSSYTQQERKYKDLYIFNTFQYIYQYISE